MIVYLQDLYDAGRILRNKLRRVGHAWRGRDLFCSLCVCVCVCVCVCGVAEDPATNLFFVNRGTIHLLCAMVQRSGHSKCGYRG